MQRSLKEKYVYWKDGLNIVQDTFQKKVYSDTKAE